MPPLNYVAFGEDPEQLPFGDDVQTYAAFNLDLRELRLVQFEGQAP